MISTVASSEEFALFNPAFLAAVLAESAAGYQNECDEDLPIPLGFVAGAMASIPQLRSALPRTVRTHHAVWLTDHVWVRPEFARLFPSLGPPLRTALLVAATGDVIEVRASRMHAPSRPSRRGLDLTDETEAVLRAARFLGRWYGRSGSPATILSLMGFDR